MKLSIIIPCYNVEDYVIPCVESVIANQLTNYEILLVNDGSTDRTLDVLKKLKKKYKEISIIDKPNGGLSTARNAGIKKAKGEYIAFIDSDDTVDKDMFSKLLSKTLTDTYDLVTCGVKMVYEDHEVLVNPGFTYDLLTKEEIKKHMYHFYPAACNKLFKASFLKEIQFKEGVWFEDVEFIYRLLPLLNKIGVVEGYYYNYYQREGSITYSYNHKLYDLVENMDSIVAFYKERKWFFEYKMELEYTYVRYLFATFVRRLAKMKDKKEFDKGVSYVIKKVKEQFPDYKKNYYLSLDKKGKYLKYFNPLFALLVYFVDRNKKN